MTALVLVGGGGHASVLLDLIQALGTARVVGYVAPEDSALSKLGVERLGDDACMTALRDRGLGDIALGLAGARDNVRRRDVFARWTEQGFRVVTLIHPSSVVSARATFEDGFQCLPMAIVNAGTRIGRNVILNSRALVEHDSVVGDHAHIGPGAVLCGGVRVGPGAFVGAGAIVVPGVSIGRDAFVAAGGVVTRDVPDGQRIAGVPAIPFESGSGERRKA